jgi:regulator of protease activity HflC (stomatin/prohibitin superfamily)
MSVIGWIIVLVLVVPIIWLLVWRFLATSFVRVPSGSLGLLMIKGKATDTALLPGRHFLPALRRRMIEEYPSVELAYRAGGSDDPGTAGLNQSGPPLQVTLGDRPVAVLSVTVRFRLIPEQLRLVHDRFGPDGFFGVVRDETGRAVTTVLAAPGTGVDALFGPAREESEKRVRSALESGLAAAGMQLTSLLLGPADLGRTGEVIAATARAGCELEREQAEAATRQARAVNDADLQRHVTSPSTDARRYRQTDLWRDLVTRTRTLQVALRTGPASTADRDVPHDEVLGLVIPE